MAAVCEANSIERAWSSREGFASKVEIISNVDTVIDGDEVEKTSLSHIEKGGAVFASGITFALNITAPIISVSPITTPLSAMFTILTALNNTMSRNLNKAPVAQKKIQTSE